MLSLKLSLLIKAILEAWVITGLKQLIEHSLI